LWQIPPLDRRLHPWGGIFGETGALINVVREKNGEFIAYKKNFKFSPEILLSTHVPTAEFVSWGTNADHTHKEW
jgi:hypothetical protein